MCFEALMWIFFADLAQEFRLSPIFVFGTGRGTLALASLFGTLFAMTPIDDASSMITGADYGSGALLVLFALILGYVLSQCEAIADRYLLSRRETEVMFLLAKGHNAAFIQDQLCISKSTAKTHINHIYRKLDIHTQQELLSMVEAARREAYDSENNPPRR